MKLLKSFLLTGLSVLAEKCSKPCGTGQLRNISQITLSDIPIGHQQHDMPKCDVGDRFVMLET